jgi:hypothetical protein
MRLYVPVLAALGVTAFLGFMSVAAPDASAAVRRTVVLSSPRAQAVVTRRPRATVLRSRRGTAVVTRGLGARGAIITSRPRGAVIVRRRGTRM